MVVHVLIMHENWEDKVVGIFKHKVMAKASAKKLEEKTGNAVSIKEMTVN